ARTWPISAIPSWAIRNISRRRTGSCRAACRTACISWRAASSCRIRAAARSTSRRRCRRTCASRGISSASTLTATTPSSRRRRKRAARAGKDAALDRQPNGCMAMDEVFKALANASRRKLLDRLRAHDGQTLSELCARLDMTRQAVSKHLAILERANLVATARRGREKLHYLNPVPINEIAERWIGKYERIRLSALAELTRGLEAQNEWTKVRVCHLHREHA